MAALGLCLSLWLGAHQADSMAQIDEARFVQEARAFSDALSQRITGHTEVVNGLRGLFTANPHLSRLDFERAASDKSSNKDRRLFASIAFIGTPDPLICGGPGLRPKG